MWRYFVSNVSSRDVIAVSDIINAPTPSTLFDEYLAGGPKGQSRIYIYGADIAEGEKNYINSLAEHARSSNSNIDAQQWAVTFSSETPLGDEQLEAIATHVFERTLLNAKEKGKPVPFDKNVGELVNMENVIELGHIATIART